MSSPQSSLLPSPILSKHQAVTFQVNVDLSAFYCMQSMHVCLKIETEVVNRQHALHQPPPQIISSPYKLPSTLKHRQPSNHTAAAEANHRQLTSPHPYEPFNHPHTNSSAKRSKTSSPFLTHSHNQSKDPIMLH